MFTICIQGVKAVAVASGYVVKCEKTAIEFLMSRARVAAFSQEAEQKENAALDVLECLQGVDIFSEKLSV